MPIKGDLKYGAKRSDPLGGIRLHAAGLAFAHPETGEPLHISAPVITSDPLWQAFLIALDSRGPVAENG
ncbi:hypothetical protein K7I13_02405 [Brucepastera parasyntrophica]|uniref:hypothetical protein n=1 Tax=Brucepastera parasyntrophica TaxID=2880008 RepID=UPI00210867A6|nr:hypothetical protein [Brucepastera parasyntrophica]ULQ61237.1 hypothetical protein K7I13_02405 [Brucepastera parasyntrophica]